MTRFILNRIEFKLSTSENDEGIQDGNIGRDIVISTISMIIARTQKEGNGTEAEDERRSNVERGERNEGGRDIVAS